MESFVNFNSGQEQVAIDALVRYFARVGSSHIHFVQSATVSLWNTLRDTELKPIDGTDKFSVADAGERTKRMSRIYSSFEYGPLKAMQFSYIDALVNMEVFGNFVVYGHFRWISRMCCETSGESYVGLLFKVLSIVPSGSYA